LLLFKCYGLKPYNNYAMLTDIAGKEMTGEVFMDEWLEAT